MAFEWWDRLTDAEKQEIADRAKETQDKTGHHICYWCRASLAQQIYDFTSSAREPRELCKGYCRNRRFFDDPSRCSSSTGQSQLPFHL